MIAECIQHPLIYSSENLNDDRFQVLMIHLNQLSNNGILLIDENKQFINEVKQNISKLSPEKRKCVEKAFINLKQRKRLEEIPLTNYNFKINNICKDHFCNNFYSLVGNSSQNCIVPYSCVDKLKNSLECNIYTLNNYSESKLYKDLDNTSFSIDDTTSFESFDSQIIIPLVKYADRLKIYDRMFVNTMTDNFDIDIKENFKNGLEFLLDRLMENNIRPDFIIEIYSSIYGGRNNSKITEIKKSLNIYISKLKRKYPFRINIFVKDRYEKFSHSRHFITDQFGITVDKGIDLINSQNKLNNNIVIVMKCDEISKIETSIRSLRNILKIE